MKVLIALVMLVGMAQSYKKFSSRQLQKLYRDKKAQFHMDGLQSARDEKEHFKEFCSFANMVKKHNEDDGVEWQGEINKFALMTEAERELYHGVNISGIENMAKLEKRSEVDAELDLVERAASADYTSKLPPIKDQAACGSCWSFGATVALEYQVNRKSSSIKALSEQQYLDCVYEGKHDGCGGGWPSLCYDWTKNNNNLIASQKDYPYVARDGPCNKNVKTAISGFQVQGTGKISIGDSYVLAAVEDSSKGVMSCAIGAYGGFHSYKSGVYSATGCDKINHAVDIVGYGTLNGILYWQVRNSWGAAWGDKGYLKVKRGPNVNTCAIASYAHYPLVTGSSDDDDKKKTCKWEKVADQKLKGRLSEMKYSLADAMKKCESEKECKGLSCKSDKKCMLNKSAKGKSDKKFTGYLCN